MSNFIVKKVAVLGAGVMGAQIAAHLANAEVPVVLFDLPAKEGDPNGIVKKAIDGLKKPEPSPLATKDRVAYIDAANYSPASCPGAVTVAATGIYSKRAFYSNYGATVEIAAPGGGVYPNDGSSGTPINDGFVWQAINDGATVPTTTYAYLGYAGTSQAAPHVSGTVALVLGLRQELAILVAALASLAPGFTVACAWLFERERLSRVQLGGVALALVGLALIAAR